MTVRLKQILSWWFILQIVLPFTAPLQTLDLHDLLGTRSHHTAPASPESSTTPTLTDAGANAFVTMLAPATLDASAAAVIVDAMAMQRPLASSVRLSSSLHVQHSVLRL